MSAALDGVRVLDLTDGISGALCTLEMAEVGAEVIKVEQVQGSQMRDWTPKIGGESAVFITLNRDKKSVCLDYRRPEGKHILRKLARNSAVLVEDLKPGEAASLGIGYEELSDLNYGLIYCSIYPFGEKGPYVNRPATELELQGMAGVMGWLGKRGREPVRLGFDTLSMSAGIQAFSGILAALYFKKKRGAGQRIVIPIYNVALTLFGRMMLGSLVSTTDMFGGIAGGPSNEPEKGYKTKDKPVMFGMITRSQEQAKESFIKFCKEIGLGKLLDDPYFVQFGSRTLGMGRDAQEFKPLFEAAFEKYTADELTEMIDRCGGVCAPFLDYNDLYNPLHPQVIANKTIVEQEHPRAGPFKMVAMPWKLSRGARQVMNPAPALGEHTREVLKLIGYSDSRIDSLQESGIVKESLPE